MDAPSEAAGNRIPRLRNTNPSLPKLSLPPRASAEATFKGVNSASPGPMTFVASLFADDPYADQQSLPRLFPVSDAKDGHSELDPDGGESQPSTHASRLNFSGTAKLLIRRSPCLPFPPELSPPTLFDSPLLFSASQVQPSPTTGTYRLLPLSEHNAVLKSEDDSKPENDFVSKPHHQMHSSSDALDMIAMAQSIPESGDSKIQSSLRASAAPSLDSNLELQENHSSTQTRAPAYPPSQLIERPSEDGYNWRKYGQKQVKGSEYPRSYYRCTCPSCPVKKKVERSYDGQITEIVYKGDHNHSKPQATRRMAMADRDAFLMASERTDAYGNAIDSSVQGHPYGEPGALECSRGPSNDDEGSKIDEHDEDDPELKRRKIDGSSEYSSNMPLRTVRESRVVVQTNSDVELLDDGYRWRKYGQKVVKGNAYPRSYYKCTNVGCSVRKQVERSSKDSQAVVTTYEGKHNHDVPADKSSYKDTNAASAPHAVEPAHNIRSVEKPGISIKEHNLSNNYSEAAESGNDAWIADPNFSQKNAEHFGDSFMGSGYGGLQGDSYFQQGLGLVPKEEPGFVYPVESLPRPPNRTSQTSLYSSRFPP